MIDPQDVWTSKSQTPEEDTTLPIRKEYKKPRLEELGDLRTLTLGTSPGVLDSLSPSNKKP